jgi:hypothetical protein
MAAGAVTATAEGTSVPVNLCVQMVEAASRSCQLPTSIAPNTPVAPDAVNNTADSLAALSTAFTYGSILLAIVALIGAVAWGFVVKGWAEREARDEAERCTKKWIEEEGFPMLRRQMEEWKRTFPPESPISDADVDTMVAALGADGREDGSGKK